MSTSWLLGIFYVYLGVRRSFIVVSDNIPSMQNENQAFAIFSENIVDGHQK